MLFLILFIIATLLVFILITSDDLELDVVVVAVSTVSIVGLLTIIPFIFVHRVFELFSDS